MPHAHSRTQFVVIHTQRDKRTLAGINFALFSPPLARSLAFKVVNER